MPLYEYLCLDCRKEFDALRSMSEADAPIRCTHCRSERTSRKISLFSAHSGGKIVAGSAHKCSSCFGGVCATCNPN